ncbi:ABC-type branched-chain amino acid transport systems, periplasmic component [Rhodopseudomonas palustris BisB5]|uniref:ABC-type branched-chain amino acid transport systems, periplasmic component n=1 Tax=Rhodopseudomonas palustris (strain BisB5) TaxID=316057 RepID=Q13DL9_RHOPS|nr:ABC-type branched-chain amino acid transport systems, periplasmic component [Rhodopseudomonas palustris BisB5]
MRRGLVAAAVVSLFGAMAPQFAFGDSGSVKVGVLTDMSGTFADMSGSGTVFSVERAIADSGGNVGGKPIKLVVADHQNKADIASSIARKWFSEDGVDVIVNAAGSAVALAVVEMAKTYNKTALVTGALSTRLTNESCSPNSIHYGLDTYALSNGAVQALSQQGVKSWYFIVADYAFGISMQRDSENFIKAAGGTVKGGIRHPLNSSDFSSYLLQAQASNADVIALGSGGSDIVSMIKQAKEFGVGGGSQKLAALALFISDVNSMGVENAQGMNLVEGFYWNYDDGSRGFSKPFYDKFKRMPTVYQAADYSGLRHYLKSALDADWTDGKGIVAQMKKGRIDDFFARGGYIREDGLLIHDLLLARVRKPADIKQPWDYYDILQTIPGDTAFQPLSLSRCEMITGKTAKQ